MRRSIGCIASLAIVLIAGPSAFGSETADILASAAPTWTAAALQAKTTSNESPATLRIGSSVEIKVSSATDSYLAILFVDSYGGMRVVQPDLGLGSRLAAGSETFLPTEGAAAWSVEPPVGPMMIAVIASPKPLNSLDRISPLGKISVYEPVAAPAVVRQLLADAADHGPWALQRINVRIIGRTSASDYTADDIEKYFGETTRSFSRPKLSLHIHFASGSATLDNTAKETLRNIGEALSRSTMSDFKFVVGGHTDNVGSAEYNKALSQRRAEAVRNYLEENYSVKGTRLEVVGYGMTRPIDKADTADARALNRRVEFDRQD